MDNLYAIGIGLVLRVVVDAATDNDNRVGGVLVGLWEGVVLSHFIRQMPHSLDPYLAFGFRIFVDFLFTQSLSRLALVALWALVGMLLADIAPNVWHDSGLRHLYRQVRKDVRHVKRSVPRIRIKNDLPSVRLFNKSRSTSSSVPSSIRSDRAAPSRSSAPSPTPGPSRRQGRSPPGTFPDVSGWSETNTDVSGVRERVVINPGPSPALIPSREHARYERIDTTHVSTSQAQIATTQDTEITITQTQKKSVVRETVVEKAVLSTTVASTSADLVDDPSRYNPPAIPDDWIDINHPTPARASEAVPAFRFDFEPPPEHRTGPPTPSQSRPASILGPPPAIDALPDIPDVDHKTSLSQPPDQIPLPESRAASVIDGVYDQPQPRSVLRDNLRFRVDKATSEIGIDPKALAPIVETQSLDSQSSSRTWTSWARSKLRSTVEPGVPEPPPKETEEVTIDQAKLETGAAVQVAESQIPTPAQVDPPPNILTQPGVTSPLLLTSDPGSKQQEQPQTNKPGQTPVSAGVDSSPAPPRSEASKKDAAGPSRTSLLDLPSPSRTPPPPFTEFAGVPEGFAAGEGSDRVAQDEVPTELTEEQKVAEEKRIAFLTSQVQELEGSHAKLQKSLDKEDDPDSTPANAIKSDLRETEKTLASIKARIEKKIFSEPPSSPSVSQVSMTGQSVAQVQFAVTSSILDVLLARDDAGPMTVQALITKAKTLKPKSKETRDAIITLAKRHNFTARFETAAPGIVDITF